MQQVTAARRPLVLLAVGVIAAGLLSGAGTAMADTRPSSPSVPTTVSSGALPTAQLVGADAIAWAQAVAGDTVFVGGSFSGASPAGSTAKAPRSNLMSYSLTTGSLGSFSPSLNGQVRAMAVSPDGSTLYVGGAFTSVDGVSRNHAAAFDVASGALKPWNPNINSGVNALQATASTVYLGGAFSSVAGVARTRVAAVSASTGAVTSWAPTVNRTVLALAVGPGGTRIALAGSFDTLDGAAGAGFGIVDSSTGRTLLATPVRQTVTDGSTSSAVYGLSTDGTKVYGSGYYSQQSQPPTGNLEGTFAVTWATGATTWLEDCHGDEYGNAVLDGVLYVVGHPHYCYDVDGGFPQISIKASQRALAFTAAATTPLKTNTLLQPRYYDFAGNPGPSLLSWFPTLATGSASGSNQAAWSVITAGKYVLLAGEFPSVNGIAQRGTARFALPSVAAATQGPQLSGSAFPLNVQTLQAGTARISWLADNDPDNETLSYTLYRGSTPVFTTSADSRLWYERPTLSYTDTTVAAGSRYTYKVVASDPWGNSATSASTTYTVPTAAASAYAQRVVADGATSYWRLGGSGTSVPDLAGGLPATVHGGVVRGAAGAIASDPGSAARFDGASTSGVASNAYLDAGDSFSVEAWFSTTSTRSGEIIGMGDQQGPVTSTRTDPTTGATTTVTQDSVNHDREVSITADGHLTFTVQPGTARTLTSGSSGYNDGSWHHVVATLGGSGAVLYIDGVRSAADASMTRAMGAAEYWRLGGDSGPPAAPATPGQFPAATPNYFAGTIDQPAVYVGTVLTAAQVAAHHALTASSGTPSNEAPTARLSSTTDGLRISVDGSASTDPDGDPLSYRWDFGDGTTASGVTASHTYAVAGTYSITLAATDGAGAAGSASKSVVVQASPSGPAVIASDSFDRSVTGGLGAAKVGGTWAVSGGSSNFSVDGGVGRLSTAAGATLTARLAPASASADVVGSVGLSALPVGGNAYASVIGRSVGGSDYRARLVVAPSGAVSLQVNRGTSALAAKAIPGLTYSVGEPVEVEVQVFGTGTTTVRARAWATGSTPPSTWQVSASDSTSGLQTAGGIGIGATASSTVTNGAIVVTFDDVSAVPAP